MYYNEFTEYERHRFNENPRCIYCGAEIKKTENFTCAKTRVGRTVVYSFLHNKCVLDAREWVKRKEGELYGKNEVRV